MDSTDWDILLTIAQELNITNAAKRLHIAQSSLSYRLRNIEEEFKVHIFKRDKRGIALTPQGEYLFQYAQTMKNQYKIVKEQVRNLEGSLEGTISVGITTVVANYVFPEVLKKFYSTYPRITIYLRAMKSHQVYSVLERNEIDIAITRGDPPWEEEKHLLYEEPICLVSSRPIKIQDLPQRPYLSHPASNINQTIEVWLKQQFTKPPQPIMEMDNSDICLQMILHGLGWSILSAVGLSRYPTLYVQPLYWDDGSPLTRKTWMLYQRSISSLPLTKVFCNFLRSTIPLYMHKLVPSV